MTTKPKKLAGELWSLAKSFSRVIVGYLLLILTVVVGRFPYHTDPVGERSVARPANYAEFYAGVYALPKQGKESSTEDSSDGRYVKMARDAIADQHVTQILTEFVSLFGLERARILDVGSGTGYLQDVVKNYVGLDISPTAARYYHKPFIEASATKMPIPDNDFDAAWSIWVLEHVPAPEQALLEIRRVVKDGGLIFMVPAWNVYPWAADGYPVRPFGDLNWKGKLAKAGMFAVEFKPLAQAVKMITRASLGTRARFGGPIHLHYNKLTPNYATYWMEDSDAINSLDRYEMQLWFTSRGDECLNCQGGFWEMSDQLIIRVHKAADTRRAERPSISRTGRNESVECDRNGCDPRRDAPAASKLLASSKEFHGLHSADACARAAGVLRPIRKSWFTSASQGSLPVLRHQ